MGAAALGSLGGAFRQGLLTNLSNPKIVLFFAAVLSQFMPVGAPAWVQLVYIAALLVTSVLWFGFIAITVSTEIVVRRLVSAGPWIDLVAGVVFAAGRFLRVAGRGDADVGVVRRMPLGRERGKGRGRCGGPSSSADPPVAA